jgi:ribosome maturation factor RimP
MIEKGFIQKLAEDGLPEGLFLVDVSVSKSNVISVFIDSMDGVNIDQCVALSRHIESNLDREAEDFELQVSSAGLGQPFKVVQQYHKHVGKKVEVVDKDGQKAAGILDKVTESGIILIASKKVQAEGSKKKLLVEEEEYFSFDNIKIAKAIISFNI